MGIDRSQSVNPMDAPTILIAAIAASAIGALFYNVLPMYLGAAQDYRGLDKLHRLSDVSVLSGIQRCHDKRILLD